MVNLVEKLEHFTIFHSLTIAQVPTLKRFIFEMVKSGEKLSKMVKFVRMVNMDRV